MKYLVTGLNRVDGIADEIILGHVDSLEVATEVAAVHKKEFESVWIYEYENVMQVVTTLEQAA